MAAFSRLSPLNPDLGPISPEELAQLEALFPRLGPHPNLNFLYRAEYLSPTNPDVTALAHTLYGAGREKGQEQTDQFLIELWQTLTDEEKAQIADLVAKYYTALEISSEGYWRSDGDEVTRNPAVPDQPTKDQLGHYLRPREELGLLRRGLNYALVYPLIHWTISLCPHYRIILEQSSAGGVPFQTFKDIAGGLSSMDKAPPYAHGVYLQVNEPIKAIRIGQSGQLGLRATAHANNQWAGYTRYILLKFLGEVPGVARRAVETLFTTTVVARGPMRVMNGSRFSLHEGDNNAGRVLTPNQVIAANAILHNAHWRAARGLGVAVPSLKSGQSNPEPGSEEHTNMLALLELLDPVIQDNAELRETPRRSLSLIYRTLGISKGQGGHDQMALILQDNLPWDARGAIFASTQHDTLPDPPGWTFIYNRLDQLVGPGKTAVPPKLEAGEALKYIRALFVDIRYRTPGTTLENHYPAAGWGFHQQSYYHFGSRPTLWSNGMRYHGDEVSDEIMLLALRCAAAAKEDMRKARQAEGLMPDGPPTVLDGSFLAELADRSLLLDTAGCYIDEKGEYHRSPAAEAHGPGNAPGNLDPRDQYWRNTNTQATHTKVRTQSNRVERLLAEGYNVDMSCCFSCNRHMTQMSQDAGFYQKMSLIFSVHFNRPGHVEFDSPWLLADITDATLRPRKSLDPVGGLVLSTLRRFYAVRETFAGALWALAYATGAHLRELHIATYGLAVSGVFETATSHGEVFATIKPM